MATTFEGSGDGGKKWYRPGRAVPAAFLLILFGSAVVTFTPSGGNFSAIDNPAGLTTYTTNEALTAAQVDAAGPGGVYGGFHNPDWTEGTSAASAHSQGQFRLICTVSHWSKDDPIIHPDTPGGAHMHMFWGNTRADAFTNSNLPPDPNDPDNIFSRGESTCQGGPLNRSAYWAPAVCDGPCSDGHMVVPKVITLYYKSHQPSQVDILPLGIQLLVGNVNPGGSVNQTFTEGEWLHWGCYEPSQGQTVGTLYNKIPGAQGLTPQCPAGQDIQATIQFPQCLATDNGLATGNPTLTSGDFLSHTHMLYDFGGNFGRQNDPCPSSHPYRVPQISYLIRFANPAGLGELNWRLSSDQGADTTNPPNPGGSLHGDWLGAWSADAIQAWIDGCFFPSLNCSLGQTGDAVNPPRRFRPIVGANLSNMEYTGPQVITIP